MTRNEFLEATGLSRGQMDRAIAKARGAGGRCVVPQLRVVMTVQGDPPDLVLSYEIDGRSAEELIPDPAASGRPTPEQMAQMTKSDLEKRKLIEEISRIQLANGVREREIREEQQTADKELFLTIAGRVKLALLRMKLSREILDKIFNTIQASLQEYFADETP